jgi:hypothetical protein
VDAVELGETDLRDQDVTAHHIEKRLSFAKGRCGVNRVDDSGQGLGMPNR